MCDQEFLIWGPDGVMVHLNADHAASPMFAGSLQQLEVPATQRLFFHLPLRPG